MVAVFYFLFFNRTIVYFFKNIFTNVNLDEKSFEGSRHSTFYKKDARSERSVNSYFLNKICFCIKAHFHNKLGNNLGHFV